MFNRLLFSLLGVLKTAVGRNRNSNTRIACLWLFIGLNLMDEGAVFPFSHASETHHETLVTKNDKKIPTGWNSKPSKILALPVRPRIIL